MRTLHRRDDALDPGETLERIESLLIRDGYVLDDAGILIIGMFWSDTRIIEARRDRICLNDLAVRILQQITERAVQDARFTGSRKCLGIIGRGFSAPTGFDTEFLDHRVIAEIVERADGITAAANTGNEIVGQAPIFSIICARISSPMTFWKSRTMVGYG